MRSKSVILLGLALGCGAIASVGISQVLQNRQQTTAPGEFEHIFVALADININEPLTPQNVGLEDWPKGKVPTGALTKLEEVDGKKVRYRLTKGEPILASKLAGAGLNSGVAGQIPPGYRLEAVKADAVSTGGSLLAPGDHVDVLASIPAGSIKGMTARTHTILQNIQVFAVDTSTQSEREKEGNTAPTVAKTVTLMVTPVQAEKLALAESLSGSMIRLVLRGPDDAANGESIGSSVNDLLGVSLPNESLDELEAAARKEREKANASPSTTPTASAEPAAAKTGKFHMTVIEGDHMRDFKFDENGQSPVATGSDSPSGDAPPQNYQPDPGVPPAG